MKQQIITVMNFLRKIKRKIELYGKNILMVEICITTRCSLRCVECSNLNTSYYVRNSPVKPRSLDIADVIDSMQTLLSTINGIKIVKILGGEPFLHPDLHRLVRFLINQSKVKSIQIATNGTLLPQNENLLSMKDKKVTVILSDYHEHSTKKDELQKKLIDNGICYWNYRFANGYWISQGPVSYRNRSIMKLKEVWNGCLAKDCKHLFDGVLYGCPRLAHAKNLGLYSPHEEEFVPLKKEGKARLWKKIFKLYSKNYLTFCNYCDGLGKYGAKVVPAIQSDTKNLSE